MSSPPPPPLFCFYFWMVLIFFSVCCNAGPPHSGFSSTSTPQQVNQEPAHLRRNRDMLLADAAAGGGGGGGGVCTRRDISISQSRDTSSGIPQYVVQIVNTCVSGCAPSDIHLHCGWFASAKMVSPRAFRRLGYDDCIVNGGRPLRSSQVVRFTYSNSFMYPLLFKSARFC